MPPYMLSEVHRLTTETNCISGRLFGFILNKRVKNCEQIITILGNFQHTDHYFLGHEFVLDKREM